MSNKYLDIAMEKVIKQEVNTVLDKIIAEIEQAADKQFQIAMGVADLNERYTHIQMENAYRHSLNVIDKYKAESEGAEMTHKEALENLMFLKKNCTDEIMEEAIDIAISALEKEAE